MTKKLGLYNIFNTVVEIVAITGGWTTYKDANGESKKARNSLITAITAEQAAAHAIKHSAIATPVVPTAAPATQPLKVVKPARKTATLESTGEEVVVHEALVQPDYTRYTKHNVKSPSGRKALDINDAAAGLLRGHDISDCYFIVAKNMAKLDAAIDPEVLEKELIAQYEHLNVGMQRMNLGNRLRKAMGTYGNLNAHKTPRVAKPETSKTVYVKPGESVVLKEDRRKTVRAD